MSLIGKIPRRDDLYPHNVLFHLQAVNEVLTVKSSWDSAEVSGLYNCLKDMAEQRPFRPDSDNFSHPPDVFEFRTPVWNAIDAVLLQDYHAAALDGQEARAAWFMEILAKTTDYKFLQDVVKKMEAEISKRNKENDRKLYLSEDSWHSSSLYIFFDPERSGKTAYETVRRYIPLLIEAVKKIVEEVNPS